MNMLDKPAITKAKAKEILQVNYGNVTIAAEKLKDPYLVESTVKTTYPVTEAVYKYLKDLDYNVSNLHSECLRCGMKYFFTPMCTDKLCRYCNHYDSFKDRLFTEPETMQQLAVNLSVLSEVFDHEISSTNYGAELDALRISR